MSHRLGEAITLPSTHIEQGRTDELVDPDTPKTIMRIPLSRTVDGPSRAKFGSLRPDPPIDRLSTVKMRHDEIDGIGSEPAGKQRVDVTELLRPIRPIYDLNPADARFQAASSHGEWSASETSCECRYDV